MERLGPLWWRNESGFVQGPSESWFKVPGEYPDRRVPAEGEQKEGREKGDGPLYGRSWSHRGRPVTFQTERPRNKLTHAHTGKETTDGVRPLPPPPPPPLPRPRVDQVGRCSFNEGNFDGPPGPSDGGGRAGGRGGVVGGGRKGGRGGRGATGEGQPGGRVGNRRAGGGDRGREVFDGSSLIDESQAACVACLSARLPGGGVGRLISRTRTAEGRGPSRPKFDGGVVGSLRGPRRRRRQGSGPGRQGSRRSHRCLKGPRETSDD